MINTKRIEQIETALLMMEYKEHWTPADWAERAALNAELNELKKEV